MSRWARSGCADGELRSSIGQTTSDRPTGPRPRLGRAVGGLPCDPVIVTPAPLSRVPFPIRGRAGRRGTTSNRPSTSRVRRRPRRVIHPRRPTRSSPRRRFLWPKPSPTGCGTTRGSNRHQPRSRRLEKARKSPSHPSCPSSSAFRFFGIRHRPHNSPRKNDRHDSSLHCKLSVLPNYYPGTEEAHTNPTRQRGECLRALAGASG